MKKVNVAEKFGLFSDHWSPKIIGQLENFHVKIAKLEGDFIWHKHDDEDELFYVVDGILTIHFRDRKMELNPGEMVIIPKGVEHKPACEKEVKVMLIEPASTINTGDSESDLKKDKLEWV